jgi:hypothetical protein
MKSLAQEGVKRITVIFKVLSAKAEDLCGVLKELTKFKA